MKKFAYSFLIFVSIILLLESGTILYKIKVAQSQVDHFFKIDDQYQYLFLGDSHIGYSILPSKELKTKVYWQSGCHPLLSLMKLKEMGRQGSLKNIKYCFVEFGYQTEASMNYCSLNSIYYTNFSYTWRYFFLMPSETWLSADELFRKDGMGMPENSPLSETTLSLTARSKEFINKQIADVIPQHFDYIQNPSSDMVENYRDSLRNTYLEIDTICRNNGIKLIVIASPLSSYYREKVPENGKLIKQDWINWMQQSHIAFLDMTESMPDINFVESHHLLSVAREDFTKKLLRIVQEKYEKKSEN